MKPLVLVTGGAGFIGSHTVDLLIEKGYRVRVLDNLSSQVNKKWPTYLHKKTEKIKGDVRNINDWEKALKGVTYVIHLAALMDFHLEFSKFFDTNTTGTANLYEAIVANRFPIKKVVVASTQFVYGHGVWKCLKHGKVHPSPPTELQLKKHEWDPKCPICKEEIKYLKNKESHIDPPNQYAISKYTQELISFKLGKIHNIPSTALRYSIVHGDRQSISSLYSGALRVFTLQIKDNKKILLFEDGQMLRDFVSVNDVARANIFVMESQDSNYEAYNVGGGKSYTIQSLAEMISEELGKTFTYELGSYREGDIRHAVSDISKIKKLGWKPQNSEKSSIKLFIEWVKKHKQVKNKVDSVFSEMKKKGILKST